MKCYITGECLTVDEHHVIKRSNGGEFGLTVDLRPDIHQTIHRCETDVDLKDRFLSSLSCRAKSRASMLISSLSLTIGGKDTYKINFSIDKKVYDRLSVIASSKRVSVNGLIKAIVENL